MKMPKAGSISLRTKIIAVVTGLVLAGLVAFFVEFSVKEVIVEGNVVYSEEEIKDLCLSSPLSINSVLFSKLEHKIDLSDHDFLDHVTVEYVDRNTIKLNVMEKQLIGVLAIDGYYYYFDQTGTVTEVLTALDEDEKNYVPIIEGLTASNIGLGHKIEFEDSSVLNTITAIRKMVDKFGVCPEKVVFDYNMNMKFIYGDITVEMGKDTLLEEKMARIAAILPELENYAGTLHLENFSSETENIVFDIQ